MCIRDSISDIAADRLGGQELRPALEIDAELPLGEVDWALQETLARLEPTGYNNPAPLLLLSLIHI